MAAKVYDFLIVGAGIAGYSAAIYAARYSLKTILIGELPGGLITKTHLIENYPGFTSLAGYELASRIRIHAEQYKVPMISDRVISIKKQKSIFVAKTFDNKTYSARAVLLATGAESKKLNIPGEKEFTNRGVSYCGTCDGPLFKGKIVGVVGGSDAAVKEALLLAEYAKKVYIICRGKKIKSEKNYYDRMIKNKKIRVITDTNVVSIHGTKFIEFVKLDKAYNKKKELKLDGLFIEIGYAAESSLASMLGVKINKKHEIITNKYSETNVSGVFAAGDVTDSRLKQAILSAADGAKAAFSAYHYLGA